MATFEEVWRRARLEMPAVPPLLVRAWAQDGYNIFCDANGWAFLRAEGILQTQASRSLEVAPTLNSTLLASAALFVPGDAGRQLKVGTTPIYTIATYVNASTVLLDLPYATVTAQGNQTATIFDAYATMPADFTRFLTIVDPYNQQVIPYWYTQDQIALADPARTNSDSGPRFLVARKYSSATATLGRVQYEYAPYPTAARGYPYLYFRAAEQLADDAVLPGVLGTRADALRTYVLSRGAMWPGTADAKNPFFSPGTAQLLQREWDAKLQQLTLTDDDVYPQQLETVDWSLYRGSLTTTDWLRQTDATVADYF